MTAINNYMLTQVLQTINRFPNSTLNSLVAYPLPCYL